MVFLINIKNCLHGKYNIVYKAVPPCLPACMPVVSYACPDLWANLDEIWPGDPGPLLTDMGVGYGSRIRGSDFKKPVAEVAAVELFCFQCFCKENNYAYTFVAGCIQQFFTFLKLFQFIRTPIEVFVDRKCLYVA